MRFQEIIPQNDGNILGSSICEHTTVTIEVCRHFDGKVLENRAAKSFPLILSNYVWQRARGSSRSEHLTIVLFKTVILYQFLFSTSAHDGRKQTLVLRPQVIPRLIGL